jgi:hypothetical protein
VGLSGVFEFGIGLRGSLFTALALRFLAASSRRRSRRFWSLAYAIAARRAVLSTIVCDGGCGFGARFPAGSFTLPLARF